MRVVGRPTTTEYVLDKWDPSGETKVWLREPRFKETAERQQFWETTAVEYEGNVTREMHEKTVADLARLELWLTYVAADIWVEGLDGKPYKPFYPDMPFFDFVQTLNGLDDTLVEEWHGKVLLLKPEWEFA